MVTRRAPTPGARLTASLDRVLTRAAHHPVVPTIIAFLAGAAAAEWVAWLRAGPGAAVALTPAAGIAFAAALLLPWRRAAARGRRPADYLCRYAGGTRQRIGAGARHRHPQ